MSLPIVKVKRMRKIANWPIKWELKWNSDHNVYEVVSVEKSSPLCYIKIKAGDLIQKAVVGWSTGSARKQIPWCDGIVEFNQQLTNAEYIELHVLKNTTKSKDIFQQAIDALRNKTKREVASNKAKPTALYPVLDKNIQSPIQPSAPYLSLETLLPTSLHSLSLADSATNDRILLDNGSSINSDTRYWGGNQLYPIAAGGRGGGAAGGDEGNGREKRSRESDDSSFNPPTSKRGRPRKTDKSVQQTSQKKKADSSSSSSDEDGEECDDPSEQQECAIENCSHDVQDLRLLVVMKGIWTLKNECKGKKPKKLKVCNFHRQRAAKITGHPEKWHPRQPQEQLSLFSADKMTIKSLKCANSRCTRNGADVVLAHQVTEAICPYHVVTIQTPSLGLCNMYYPCNSMCSEVEHRRTVDRMSSNPEVFVCDRCAPQFEYYAVDLEKDIKTHLQAFEQELPRDQGMASIVSRHDIVKSPGIVQTLKEKIYKMWDKPETERCQGMTDPHLLQWYYEELSKKKPVGVPSLVLIRLPGDERSILFSQDCSGRKGKQSTRCFSCAKLWRQNNLKRIIQNQKKISGADPKLKQNITTMSREQLEDEVNKLRMHLRNAQYEANILKKQLNMLKEQVKVPETLKLTALRLEMLIDASLKSGIVQENSQLFLLLLATVRNLRIQESKKSPGKGRSTRYHYSPEVLKIAAWLLHKCRKAGYIALTQILPGMPSLHTMQRFRAAFQTTTEPIDIPRLESMLKLMKEHKQNEPWVGGFAWDEMSIQKGLIINQRTGDAVGFEDCPDISEMEKTYTDMAKTTEQRILLTQEPPTMDEFPFADWTDEQLIEASEELPDEQRGEQQEEASDQDDRPMGIGDDDVQAYNKAQDQDDQPRLAKQILSVFWTSISGDFAAPIATFGVESLTYSKFQTIFDRVFKVFDAAVAKVDINLATRYVVCDGSTYSDAFFRRQNPVDHRIPYPGKPGTMLWVISDPPHLMKKLRNVLFNDGHTLTYVLERVINGLPTKVEIPLYSKYFLTKAALSGETILQPKHVELTPKTKMNVKMAVQTLSSSVADYIWDKYLEEVLARMEGRGRPEEPNPFPWPIAEYLRQAEAMFSVLNANTLDMSKTPENRHTVVYDSNKKPKYGMYLWMHKLIKCQRFFQNWEQALRKHGIDIGKAFITKPCHRHLGRTLNAFIGLSLETHHDYPNVKICPRAINQDCVENYFSLTRERVANKNPTLNQVREGTASLSFLFQMQAEKKFESEIGAYSAAQTTGAPQLLPPTGPTDARKVIRPDEVLVAFQGDNWNVEESPHLEAKHKYIIRRHLSTSMTVAKLKIPTSSITANEQEFFAAVEKPIVFNQLLEQFYKLHAHSRKWFFHTNYYKVNTLDVTGHYLYNARFKEDFLGSAFLRKLNIHALPIDPYLEKLLKHFLHRTYVYYVRVDGLSPFQHREVALRARLETNMGRGPTNSMEGGRTYGDVCLRCKQVGHCAAECPEPPDKDHLQSIQCFNCQALGHIARSCPHDRQAKPYRGYPTGVTLEKILDRLKISNLIGLADYVPYRPDGDTGRFGIKQHSPTWFLKHKTPGILTGSTASYALVETTVKRGTVVAKSGKIRQLFYNYHCGDLQAMESIQQLLYGNKRGPIDSDDVINWGSAHEASAVLTLLKNMADIQGDIDEFQFLEVGMLDVGGSGKVWSSPDGLIVLTNGSRQRIAVEAKCPVMAGKPSPARSVSWRHYVQVALEMAALQADNGLYVSWTPIGATVFKIGRNKLLENRLLEYLNSFVDAATRKLPYNQGGNCQEALAAALTNEIQETAKSATMVVRCTSEIDHTAKMTTNNIVAKIDRGQSS